MILNSLLGRLVALLIVMLSVFTIQISAQIDSNGCVGGGFEIDAGVYSGVIEYGDGIIATNPKDWFQGISGLGIINEADSSTIKTLLQSGGNPLYEARQKSNLVSLINGQVWIDAVYARDFFGGTGHQDATSYLTASKNGEDPAIWDPGVSNVLGKNDLIDVAGHMFRDGTGTSSDLWFVGLINRAESGGSAYMDFEFYVEDIQYNPGSGFTSGGPELGHTAFQFDASGNITKIGDFIFNTSLAGGGDIDVEMRLWVSYADYTTATPPVGFTWGPDYDGAFNGSPYGYASIIPLVNDICGIINTDNINSIAPPWGYLGTKSSLYLTNYSDYTTLELGVNLTALGIDHSSLAGVDTCVFPLNTFIVKTRASASFTAQLKDFSGPYEWGQPNNQPTIIGNPIISCDNPVVELTVSPLRTDVNYIWTTVDGNILTDSSLGTILVNKPGSYQIQAMLPTGCPIDVVYQLVDFDPTKPFFNEPTATTTVACNGNDGSIDLTVTGATPTYSYKWYNQLDSTVVISTNEDLTGLSPGNYYVVITDQIPCDITSEIFTVDPKATTIITGSLTHVLCFGGSSGAIDATATGNPPYTYSWSNGSSLEDIAGLSAGTYTLTVTDVDGCETQQSFVITQPSVINLSASATNETDNTLDDGTIDLTVSGGTPNYSYSWTGPNSFSSTNEDLTGLAAGTYIVTVTDTNGCTNQISVTILEPEICFDGIDNDGDGLTDCFDPDCTVSPPGSITTSSNPVCVGDTGVTYSIVSTGADSYTWTVPAGAAITAGQGTEQITVNWVSNISGQICVKAVIDGCESTPSCFTVQLNDVPPAAGTITIGN